MALSANLFLRQNQSLVMTPQLMQSIQLLQMTHFELLQFIAQEVEKNPLLEIAPNDDSVGSSDTSRDGEVESLALTATADGLESDWYERSGDGVLNDRLDANYDASFGDDSASQKLDSPEMLDQWKSMPGTLSDGGEGYDLDDFVAGKVSLREHLGQQLPFVLSSPGDRHVALVLIDQLDDAGYLRVDLTEVSSQLGVQLRDVERILATLQTMEPAGIFARDLGECLAIQLGQRDRLDPAMATLVKNLDLLGKRDFATLKRLCGVDEEDLLDMLAEIRKLNPKPGAGFENSASETVIPDVLVSRGPDGSWLVELNAETLPRVLVNNTYFAQIKQNSTKAEGEQGFLAECLQTANWLTRSLDQRAKTIMKVSSEIIRQQDAFLRYGVDHLRPLNLKTVADAIKMHESTVSRVTANKYMLTPRGLFELKYFFSVSIGSAEGGDNHSAEAVRHRIRALIAQESADSVLSDDDIVDSLKKGGVELARRTVAKYREAMNIPSSVQRRREKRAIAKNAP
ncbi:RNA polymerase factor sigma-54 [Rhizobium oryziradicis]|uniref:RNA polymerase sigma-54 factor n=1 Tax=Rhizobium oryziradicis TaxID=1867956 RepID=A0A1Q8ZTA4_9HYPH|nr:RNA polymerase factor sigma-54 [Rhizobium oryziradicis]OLP45168.1 RNA polymerase sigma-54 factor [Rhizobium oryziradicis]